MLFVVCRSLFVCDMFLVVCLFGVFGLLRVIPCLEFGDLFSAVGRVLLFVCCALLVFVVRCCVLLVGCSLCFVCSY